MKSVNYKIIMLVAVVGILSGCMRPSDKNFDRNIDRMKGSVLQDIDASQTVQEEAKKISLPPSVSAQMMPTSSVLPGEKNNAAPLRFDVSVNDVGVKEFFAGLSQGSNTSLILAPGVSGKITLQLKQVTLIEVLDAVSKLYGYRYTKTSYGYSISPKELETRIFMLDKLGLQRTLQTNTEVNSSSGDLTQGGASSSGSGVSVTAPSTVTIKAAQKDDFWTDTKTTIAALIGANPSLKTVPATSPMVQVIQSTGMIVVRAYPDEMAMVESYLKKTERILGREVIIEAEILDVTLSDQYSAGIDWQALTAGGVTTASATTLSTQSLLSNAYTLSLSGDRNNFNYALSLISTQGKVSVLSKPRVSTINNQSAIIKVGSDNYYVTNVQSQVTTNGTTSASNTTTSTINLQAFFSGISLYVTPQITEDGMVNLHIHPYISKVNEDSLSVTVDDQQSILPVAQSQIRETDTVVHAKSGQVIILGGLMQNAASDTSSGLPLKEKYKHGAGAALTSRDTVAVRNELVILLRPLITDDSVWKSELNKTAKSAYSKKLNTEFFDNAYEN